MDFVRYSEKLLNICNVLQINYLLEFKLSLAVPGFPKSAALPCPSFCESLADDFVTVPDEVGEGLAFQHAVGEQRKPGDLVQ